MKTWKTRKRVMPGALFAAIAAIAFGVSVTGAEADTAWTIQSTSGEARFVDQDGQAAPASTGTEVDAGDRVVTGEDGRIVLVRGEERITVSPSSDMGLPVENKGPYATQILQNLGTILLKVQKQPNQHFEVKTPYMAAVVKGTTFTVSVSDRGTAVHVVEGAVQVADLSGTQVQLVRPGQTATRGAATNAPLDVSGIDAPAKKPAKKAEADSAVETEDAKSDEGTSDNGTADSKSDNAAVATSNQAAKAAEGKGPNGDGPSGGKGKSNGTQIASAIGAVDLDLGSATSGLVIGKATVGKSRSAERGASAGDAAPESSVVAAVEAPGNSASAVSNAGGNSVVASAASNSNAGGNGNGNGNSDSGSSNSNAGGNGNGSSNSGSSNSNAGGNGNGNSNSGSSNSNAGGNGNGSSNSGSSNSNAGGNSGSNNSGNSGSGNSGNSGSGNSGNSGSGNSGNSGSGNSGNSGSGNSGGGNGNANS